MAVSALFSSLADGCVLGTDDVGNAEADSVGCEAVWVRAALGVQDLAAVVEDVGDHDAALGAIIFGLHVVELAPVTNVCIVAGLCV